MSTIAYLDGQALAIKLAKQITRVVAEMNKRLMTLNGMSDESLEFDDIKDPQECHDQSSRKQKYRYTLPAKKTNY